jgi:hypothetical protein
MSVERMGAFPVNVQLLRTGVFANDLTFFLGRGPGTVQEQFHQFSFSAFDPTWGKVIYEYGLLGSLVYFRFFYVAFCKGPKGLRFAVGYTYFFLGGYLLNPSVLMQVAALVVWVGKAIPVTHRWSERRRSTARERSPRRLSLPVLSRSLPLEKSCHALRVSYQAGPTRGPPDPQRDGVD